MPGRLGEDRPPRRLTIVQFRQSTGDPLGSAEPRPRGSHDQRGEKRRNAPRSHHLRLAGECDRCRYEHDGVDRRRGEHERQRRRADRAITEEATSNRNRTAFTTGQRGPADAGGEDRCGGSTRQPPRQPFWSHECCDESADHNPEGQERNGLNEDAAEYGGRGRQIR